MFSATKFVVAGVIVALFGGFLLAGVLTTQQDEEPLPAVGASPSASTTPPVISTQAELLPGVELVTQQFASTVFRVLGDGAGHDLSRIWQVALTPDEEAWILTMQPDVGGQARIFRLGEPGAFTSADGIPEIVEGIEVGADDRLYAHASKPGKVTLDDWRVLTDQGWVAPTREERAAATRRLDESVGSRVNAADGTTWQLHAGPDDDAIGKDLVHRGPNGRTTYQLEDMNFDWGKKWLKATGLHKIRLGTLAAAPDGRVWSLWAAGNNANADTGLALAEFDGETWTDITPQQWRYRSRWPFGDDERPGGIYGAALSVDPDGMLHVTVDIHDFDIHWPGDGPAPVERVVAGWDGDRWAVESRTSWDLASIPKPSGPMAGIWIADVAPSGTMVLQIGFDGLDTLLYVIEPEVDESLDEDELMAP
jgi:hypothetical protein